MLQPYTQVPFKVHRLSLRCTTKPDFSLIAARRFARAEFPAALIAAAAAASEACLQTGVPCRKAGREGVGGGGGWRKKKNIVILKEKNPISRRKAWLNDCFWQNVIRTEFTVAA